MLHDKISKLRSEATLKAYCVRPGWKRFLFHVTMFKRRNGRWQTYSLISDIGRHHNGLPHMNWAKNHFQLPCVVKHLPWLRFLLIKANFANKSVNWHDLKLDAQGTCKVFSENRTLSNSSLLATRPTPEAWRKTTRPHLVMRSMHEGIQFYYQKLTRENTRCI